MGAYKIVHVHDARLGAQAIDGNFPRAAGEAAREVDGIALVRTVFGEVVVGKKRGGERDLVVCLQLFITVFNIGFEIVAELEVFLRGMGGCVWPKTEGAEIAARALTRAEAEQEELLRNLCRESADKMFVAEMGGQIAGFVSYALDVGQTGVGEIGLNAVHPDYAGQGLGTALYDFVLARMREAGMRVATVGTGGDAAHAPARRDYEKAGFCPYLPSIYMYKAL